jgi:hypothetical protein
MFAIINNITCSKILLILKEKIMATARDVINKAKEFEQSGKIDKAKKFYQAVVDRMPGTDVAKEAQENLDRLNQNKDNIFDDLIDNNKKNL